MTELPKAVCALILNDKGKILAVSRRGRPDNMNLPGGKVDEGENLEQALIRELKEETGVDVVWTDLIMVRNCEGETTYKCYCYAAVYKGEPKSTEEGIEVRWITWEELLNERNSFAGFNRELFKTIRGIS